MEKVAKEVTERKSEIVTIRLTPSEISKIRKWYYLNHEPSKQDFSNTEAMTVFAIQMTGKLQ